MVVEDAPLLFRELAKRLLLDKPLRRASVGALVGADSVVVLAADRRDMPLLPLFPRRLLIRLPDDDDDDDDEPLLKRPPLLSNKLLLNSPTRGPKNEQLT